MRAAGLLLLLSASVAAGIYGASLAGREFAQTAALLEFLRYLRAGVEKGRPLAPLLSEYGRGAAGTALPTDHPLLRCGFLPRLREGASLPDALRCCDAVGSRTAALFREIGQTLETGRSDELERRFPEWERTLSETVTNLRTALGGRQKVSVTLGVCAGLLLAILLW